MKERQLIHKYELDGKTFVRNRSKFKAKKEITWGEPDYTLAEEDFYFLECCKADPYTARKHFNMVPFYRYLVYLFSVCNVEDTYRELVFRKFIKQDPKVRLAIREIHSRFLAECVPTDLKSIFQKNRPPTKRQEKHWAIFVDLLGIAPFYNSDRAQIEFYEDLFQDILERNIVDTVLTTVHADDELFPIFAKIVNGNWTTEQILFYKNFYYDITVLDEETFKEYLRLIDKHLAIHRLHMYSKTLTAYQIEKGLIWDKNIDILLEDAMTRFAQKFHEGMNLGTEEGLNMAIKCLKELLGVKRENGNMSNSELDIFNKEFMELKKDDITQPFIDQFGQKDPDNTI